MPRGRIYTGRSSYRGGSKRGKDWFGFSPSVQTLTAAGGSIVYSLNAAALAIRPFTIVRTHMELYILSDQTANSENQLAAWAWAVVSDQAAAVGVTAVPTPITDIGSDLFFVHQVLLNALQVSSAVSIQQVGTRYSVDSKAMRKVSESQDIVGVLELDASGAGLTVLVGGRMMVKLH